MSKHPTIFLDIDGVLNSEKYLSSGAVAEQRAALAPNCPARYRLACAIDPAAILILESILVATNSRIVISSSWRNSARRDNGRAELARMLEFRGLRRANQLVVGCTPELTRRARGILMAQPRHQEIRAYMADHGAHNYVVIDDDPDACVDPDRFVLTRFDAGLTLSNADRAIDILKGCLQ